MKTVPHFDPSNANHFHIEKWWRFQQLKAKFAQEYLDSVGVEAEVVIGYDRASLTIDSSQLATLDSLRGEILREIYFKTGVSLVEVRTQQSDC